MLCSSILRTAFVGISVLIPAAVEAQFQPLQNHGGNSAPHKSSTAAKPMSLEEHVAEVARFPNDPVAVNNLSVAYTRSGRLREALEAGLRAVKLKGDVAVYQVNLAGIYDRLGQISVARERAGLAAKLDPKRLYIRTYVCELDFALDRPGDATGCYRSVVHDFPAEPEPRLKLGLLLTRMSKFAEARVELEKAREIDPQDAVLLNTLGIVYFHLKEKRRAAAMIKEAVELDPDRSLFRFNLAVCYLAMKNRDGALSQYNLIKKDGGPLAKDLNRMLFGKFILDVRR